MITTPQSPPNAASYLHGPWAREMHAWGPVFGLKPDPNAPLGQGSLIPKCSHTSDCDVPRCFVFGRNLSCRRDTLAPAWRGSPCIPTQGTCQVLRPSNPALHPPPRCVPNYGIRVLYIGLTLPALPLCCDTFPSLPWFFNCCILVFRSGIYVTFYNTF